MWPFVGRSWKKRQKSASILTILVGLFLAMISSPFAIKFQGWTLLSTGLGGLLFLIGLLYFVEVGIE